MERSVICNSCGAVVIEQREIDSVVLSQHEWLAEEDRVHNMLQSHLDRFQVQKQTGQVDPILDFLFRYYSIRPGQLRRWSPGHGVLLSGVENKRFLRRSHFVKLDGSVVGLDKRSFPPHRRRSIEWIAGILRATNSRPPFLGCNGMHEWAMVYGEDPIRHSQLPLRFDRQKTNSIVEEHRIVCSHYDAFRFFTPQAKPLNLNPLTLAGMTEFEQPGCLHTNMDIYRWAGKLYPWIASSILADAFLLALRIREIDMRASPYDMSEYNLAPIQIETTEGKLEYQSFQKAFFEEGVVLREKLIAAVDSLSTWLGPQLPRID